MHDSVAAYTPPPPPPKPGSHNHSHDATRLSTPTPPGGFNLGALNALGPRGSLILSSSPSPQSDSPAPTAAAYPPAGEYDASNQAATYPGAGAGAGAGAVTAGAQTADIQDPGDRWLPQILQDKSKQDLAAILASPALLNALTHSPDAAHSSVVASRAALQAALAANVDLASHLADLETRLGQQRAATQAQLLSTHALDRQWRQKQADMDHALAPFAPSSLYQRLGQGVQEQAAVCQALEESFLEGGGAGSTGAGEEGGAVTEREVSDWVRRYREARVLYYLRQERKERWDEGRVGGWR